MTVYALFAGEYKCQVSEDNHEDRKNWNISARWQSRPKDITGKHIPTLEGVYQEL